MTGVSDRATGLVIAGVIALLLIAGSPPRIVGDGGEYLVQALNFAQLNTPPLGRRAIASIEPVAQAVGPELTGWSIDDASIPAADRRRDFLHFWMYALLATPPMWLTMGVGVSPLWAFTILNLALFAFALWIVLPHIGRSVAVLLYVSPFIWWIDKAHTEVFTVSLLTIAIVTMRDRPWWALAAAGLAATQNPPITVVVLAILAVEIVRRRASFFADRRLVAGAAAGLALAVLQPAYTYARHGTPSLLLYATRPGLPTWAEISAVVFDPSIGLIGNYPIFLAATIVAAVWLTIMRPRAWLTPEMFVAAVSSLVFFYAFARTSNIHHGATPSLTRYALWFIPMSIPLWTAVRATSGPIGRKMLAGAAVSSALVSVFAFHPRLMDHSREPTWLAGWLWTAHPTWHNPLPETFSEILWRNEGLRVPAATAACEKVLIASSARGEGVWPVPCLPAPLPAHCRAPNVLCYANRRGAEYSFTRAPGRDADPIRVGAAVWPAQAEVHVRRIFLESDWASMIDAPAGIVSLRAQHGVRVAAFGNDERFLLVLRPEAPNAVLRFRTDSVLEGTFIEPTTGEVVAEVRFTGPAGDLWEVPVPPGASGLVILTMRRGDPIE